MEKESNIHYKSKEELERQHDLANLSALENSESETEMPERLKHLSAEEMRNEIRKIRLQPERSLEDEAILQSYERYVENVRQLRREQENQIEQALEGIDDPKEKREAFLKSLSWSESLQGKILEKMQHPDQRMFTEVQISQAAATQEGFSAMLEQAIILDPAQIITILPELGRMIPEEQLDVLVEKAIAQKPEIVARFPQKLQSFYGEAWYAEAFPRAALAGAGKMFLQILKNQTFAERIGLDTTRQIVTECIKKDARSIAEIPEWFWEKGVVDIEFARSIIFDNADKRRRHFWIEGIKTIWNYLSDAEKEAAREEVRETLKTAVGRYSLDAFYQSAPILDEDEIKKLVSERLLSNDSIYVADLGEVTAALDQEQYAAWLHEVVAKKKPGLDFGEDAARQIMDSDVLTKDEKQQFIEILINEKPDWGLFASGVYFYRMSPEDRSKKLIELAQKVSSGVGVARLNGWLPAMAEDVKDQREILKAYLLKDNELGFVDTYVSQEPTDTHAQLLRTVLSKDEVVSILNKKIEGSPDQVFSMLPSIKQILGGDEELKAMVERVRNVFVTEFFENLNAVAYLYSPEELASNIHSNLLDLSATEAVLSSVDVWGPRLGREWVAALIDEYKEYVVLFPRFINKVAAFVPELTRENVFQIVLNTNPAAILILGNIDEGFKDGYKALGLETLRQKALSDEQMLAFAPKSLREFWTTLDVQGDMMDPDTLATNRRAALMYLRSGMIRQSGLEDIYKTAIVPEASDTEEEEQSLSLMAAYIRMKRRGLTEGIDESAWRSAADVELALFTAIKNTLGAEEGLVIDQERISQFLRTMETPGPFVSYLSQYSRLPAHRKILSDMFEAITAGTYEEWKYGPDEGALEEFKKNGWIPEITPEQYAIWRKDDTSSLYESLQSSAADVAGAIKKLLADNAGHLQVMAFGTDAGGPDAFLDEVKEELKSVGAELAALGKEVSLLKREGKTESEEMTNLLARKMQVEDLRAALTKNRDVVRLSMLTPEEVTSGYLIEKDKKVQRIQNFIESLRKIVPNEAVFVIDRVDETLQHFKKGGAEKEDIVCEDTSSPKVMIEIGEVPVPSCQNYENGTHNSCLIGYSEPNTKIIIIKNADGNIIARSIIRLLQESDNRPVLQVERIYSTTASQGVNKAIFEHAMRKAEALGIPLRGGTGDVPEGIGFITEQVHGDIASKGSRAPKIYVDSAGGVQYGGKYSITDTVLVKRL